MCHASPPSCHPPGSSSQSGEDGRGELCEDSSCDASDMAAAGGAKCPGSTPVTSPAASPGPTPTPTPVVTPHGSDAEDDRGDVRRNSSKHIIDTALVSSYMCRVRGRVVCVAESCEWPCRVSGRVV